MSNIAFWSLWVFVFTMPWEFSMTLPGIGSPGRLAGIFALALGLLSVILRGRFKKPGFEHLVIIAFVAWSSVSLLWSIDPASSEIRVQTYIQLLLMVWLLYEVSDSPSRHLALMQAYVLGSYLHVIGTVRNFILGEDLGIGGGLRFSSMGIGPNEAGFLMALGIPLAWLLLLKYPHGRLRWVNRLYLPIALFAIILTASRGSLIPAVIALSLIPWTLTRVPLTGKALVVGVSVLTVYGLNLVVPQATRERFLTTQEQIEDGTLGGRGIIWAAGLEAAAENPMFGLGAGAFPSAIRPILGYRRPPHSTYLSVLVGQGLLGLFLFVAMFFWPTVGLGRLGREERRFWLTMMMVLSVGFISRTWDYRKPAWFLLGVFAAEVAATRDSRQRRSLTNRQTAKMKLDNTQIREPVGVQIAIRGPGSPYSSTDRNSVFDEK